MKTSVVFINNHSCSTSVIAFTLVLICAVDGFSNPSRKTWWTKRVTADSFHTAGRLSARQIKYASEYGFRTIVSLFNFDSSIGDDSTEGGSYLPTTAEARHIAEDLAGINYAVVLDSPGLNDWKNLEVIRTFHDIVRGNPKPILFHCKDSYSSTFVTLAFLANVTTHGENAVDEPAVRVSDIFTIGAQLGYEFGADEELTDVVFDLTGERVDDTPASITQSNDWYLQYWLMKPVYKNWFVSGQFQEDQLGDIRSADVKIIMNTRKGVTIPSNTPSQEEVSLLNIMDITGTYSDGGRQTTAALEANRLDPHKSTEYISLNATVNYESRNSLEFGDDIGYNERLQRETLRKYLPEIHYYHIPIGGKYGLDTTMWNAYKDAVLTASDGRRVLHQCRTGFRAGVLCILGAAYTNCFSSDWAIERARQIGYVYNTSVPAVLTLYQDVLDGRADIGECLERRDMAPTTDTTDPPNSACRGPSPHATLVALMMLYLSYG